MKNCVGHISTSVDFEQVEIESSNGGLSNEIKINSNNKVKVFEKNFEKTGTINKKRL